MYITKLAYIKSLIQFFQLDIEIRQTITGEYPTWISFQIFSSFLRLLARLSLLRKIYWSSSALVIILQPVTSHKFSACDLKDMKLVFVLLIFGWTTHFIIVSLLFHKLYAHHIVLLHNSNKFLYLHIPVLFPYKNTSFCLHISLMNSNWSQVLFIILLVC